MYRIRRHTLAYESLQILHSFVQQHLNYFSLIWGFVANLTYIRSLATNIEGCVYSILMHMFNLNMESGWTRRLQLLKQLWMVPNLPMWIVDAHNLDAHNFDNRYFAMNFYYLLLKSMVPLKRKELLYFMSAYWFSSSSKEAFMLNKMKMYFSANVIG